MVDITNSDKNDVYELYGFLKIILCYILKFVSGSYSVLCKRNTECCCPISSTSQYIVIYFMPFVTLNVTALLVEPSQYTVIRFMSSVSLNVTTLLHVDQYTMICSMFSVTLNVTARFFKFTSQCTMIFFHVLCYTECYWPLLQSKLVYLDSL